MKRKMYWKKIAAILMTTAFLLQGQAVFAAETEVQQTAETQAAVQAEAPETEAPQTEAPQTEAPETEAPQTEAPQTEAPQTEAPQTEAPQTEAPQTEAPQTEAPQTEAPETEAPQTEAPETEAPQTEAPETEAPQTEAPETEAPQTEAPKKENADKEEAKTEKETEEETETEAPVYKTAFRYEDAEVIVTAAASEAAQLPENTEMKVEKLQPNTPKYEEAKRATEAKYGVNEDAVYTFYDVTFNVNGQEIKAPDGTVTIQIQFKTIQKDTETEQQSVLHIDDTQNVNDVTAPVAEGGNMSSVNFAL